MNDTNLYRRDGSQIPAEDAAKFGAANKAGVCRRYYTYSCIRCGGAGRGPWQQDGGICYRCNGHNSRGFEQGEELAYTDAGLIAVKKRDAAKAAKAEREANAREAARTENLKAGLGDYYADFMAVVMAWRDHDPNSDEKPPFCADFFYDLNSKAYRQLSEKQIAAVKRAIDSLRKHAQDKAAQDLADIVPPEGRVALEGVIVGFKYVPGFGYNSADVAKIVVKCPQYRVYMTLPSAIDDAHKGDTIAFEADLTPKEKGFAIGKRPTKARITARAGA